MFPLDAMRWGFFLGDVCGKGPRAAAITSLTRYTLRAAAVQDPEPVAALTVLNTVLDAHSTDEDLQYCTAIYGMLTLGPASFTVHLASGGHPRRSSCGVTDRPSTCTLREDSSSEPCPMRSSPAPTRSWTRATLCCSIPTV
ncbi:serine/threonine-protein phosphatase [Actinomadura madurae]|nr:PP2C family protein-serine/threonine phosphatase [Actinomadura madurae]URN07927.1 serine/threonine-protein phosphatase [Actinomadura madurae]